MAISFSFDSSEILMPSTLAAWSLHDAEARVHRGHVVGGAPVAGERRIEHLAEPVDDHRLLHLGAGCGRRRARNRPGPCATRASARLAIRMMRPPMRLDRLDLLLVGADDVVDRHARRWRRDDRCRRRRRSARRAAPSRPPARGGSVRCAPRPVEAHAALRGVHRLGDAEPEVPEIFAERDGACPSRPRRRARDRCRPADRRPHARPHRRCG